MSFCISCCIGFGQTKHRIPLHRQCFNEIRNLTIDEITGVITETEKNFLYEVIANSQEAFDLWQELHSVLDSYNIQEDDFPDPKKIILAVERDKRSRFI